MAINMLPDLPVSDSIKKTVIIHPSFYISFIPVMTVLFGLPKNIGKAFVFTYTEAMLIRSLFMKTDPGQPNVVIARDKKGWPPGLKNDPREIKWYIDQCYDVIREAHRILDGEKGQTYIPDIDVLLGGKAFVENVTAAFNFFWQRIGKIRITDTSGILAMQKVCQRLDAEEEYITKRAFTALKKYMKAVGEEEKK